MRSEVKRQKLCCFFQRWGDCNARGKMQFEVLEMKGISGRMDGVVTGIVNSHCLAVSCNCGLHWGRFDLLYSFTSTGRIDMCALSTALSYITSGIERSRHGVSLHLSLMGLGFFKTLWKVRWYKYAFGSCFQSGDRKNFKRS